MKSGWNYPLLLLVGTVVKVSAEANKTEAEWSPWGDWSKCSTSCGSGGQQLRTRQCSTYGGLCKGDKTEAKDCQTSAACAVWSDWGDWGSCSTTCGSGTQQRSRQCSGYGAKCVGDKTESKDCSGPPCCTSWSEWSSCSLTCGSGTQKRSQTCGSADKSAKNYLAAAKEESQNCNTFTCPVWTAWNSWSDCTESCTSGYGKSGTHTATRECKLDDKYCKGYLAKSPACNCTGSDSKTESCNTFSCPKWADWSNWSECSASCTSGYGKSGTHERNRDCKIDKAYCTGYNVKNPVCKCEGDSKEAASCNTFSCPKWSEWGSWTDCSKSCAVGSKSHLRTCKLDDSYCTGDKLGTPVCKCEGNDKSQENCNTFACPVWSEWSAWADCSVSCKSATGPSGVHNRKRNCKTDQSRCSNDGKANNTTYVISKPNLQPESDNSRVVRGINNDPCTCPGTDTDMESCNNFACPYYSEWSAWGLCSVSCGGGSHTQTRDCITDKSYCINGGDKNYVDKLDRLSSAVCKCVGVPSQSGKCNIFVCPIWSEWGSWEDCSISCKSPNGPDGVHLKRRICKTDQTQCGTNSNSIPNKVKGSRIAAPIQQRIVREADSINPCVCPGSDTASEGCNKDLTCPYYSEWGRWSDCSVTCGGGSHFQTRNCITAKLYCTEGKLGVEPVCKCVGTDKQDEKCNIYSCPIWATWSSWSDCSTTCTGSDGRSGVHIQSRGCQVDKTYCSVDNLGTPPCKCVGETVSSAPCNRWNCPIWADWSAWGDCSLSCSAGTNVGGIHSRKRVCKVDSGHCTSGSQSSIRTRNRRQIDQVCICPGNDTSMESCNKVVCPFFTEWGAWGLCTVTCGGGKHVQNRDCKVDTDFCHNDQLNQAVCKCAGPVTQPGDCNTYSCPIWSEWGQYGQCSSSCKPLAGVAGLHVRNRQCKTDANRCADGGNANNLQPEVVSSTSLQSVLPQRKFAATKRVNRQTVNDNPCVCPGNNSSSEICNDFVCPYYGEWGAWGSCSVSCAGGTHSQDRICNTDKSYCTPERLGTDPVCSCTGPATQSERCNTFSCPIWTEWLAWGDCSLTCKAANGQAGSHTRKRTCNTDATKCTNVARVAPVNNQLNGNNNSPKPNPFAVSNKHIVRRDRRQIANSDPCVCPGTDSDSENCNTFSCPVWSEWGSWADCSISCKSNGGAAGTHAKTRTCLTDATRCAANSGGTGITGPTTNGQNFGTGTVGPTVSGTGSSNVSRNIRFNDNLPLKRNPLNPNNFVRIQRQITNDPCVCAGSNSASETCNDIVCPNFSEWGVFSTCSVSCGGGDHSQTRNCLTDTAYCTGERLNDLVCKCNGNTTQSERCNTFTCPSWGDWGNWGSCSISCKATATAQAGVHQRNRLCQTDPVRCSNAGGNSVPGGLVASNNNSLVNTRANKRRTQRQVTNDLVCSCPGSNGDSEPCNNIVCAAFSEWGAWGPCSVQCGGGTHSCSRSCQPDPNFCTSEKLQSDPVCRCTGDLTKSESCNTFACAIWNEWGAWGQCSASCVAQNGQIGVHTKTRVCKVDTIRCPSGGRGTTSGSNGGTTFTGGNGGTTATGGNGGTTATGGTGGTTFTGGNGGTIIPGGNGGTTATGANGGTTATGANGGTTFTGGNGGTTANGGIGGTTTVGGNGGTTATGGATDSNGGTIIPGGNGNTITGTNGGTTSNGGTGGTIATGTNGVGPINNGTGLTGTGTVATGGNEPTLPTGGTDNGISVPTGTNGNGNNLGTAGTVVNPTLTVINTSRFQSVRRSDGISTSNSQRQSSRPFNSLNPNNIRNFIDTISHSRSARQTTNDSFDPCVCPGGDSTLENCNAFKCSFFSEWGAWSSCSSTCGSGNRTQTRNCITDQTYCTQDRLNSDPVCTCTGPTVQGGTCTSDPCPTFSPWANWGTCSVTCGNGTSVRSRNCSRSDAPCIGNALDRQSCFAGACYTWQPWESWSGDCQFILCGGGSVNRTRKCPVEGACPGLSVESSICNQQPCPDWGQWAEWSGCSVSCGGGGRVRTRSCPLKDSCKPGTPFQVDPVKCNPNACPSWTEWTPWGICSASCGVGNRRRNRTCSLQDGCPGRTEDVDPCSATPCPPVIPLSPWSECSKTCGGGLKTRSKTSCAEGPPTCPVDSETSPCNEQICPLWESWGPWSDCSKTCGSGQRTRQRACPIINGCIGQQNEIDALPCNAVGCPTVRVRSRIRRTQD